jgi:hypothetical protein
MHTYYAIVPTVGRRITIRGGDRPPDVQKVYSTHRSTVVVTFGMFTFRAAVIAVNP